MDALPAGRSAIVAMGKLGGREMTAASDLDLIVVYDFAAHAQGVRRREAPARYSVLHPADAAADQRACIANSEGRLYEVDMRLRPSGQKGPVATQLSSFIEYQQREAWTWEHLALTRARVISGPPALRERGRPGHPASPDPSPRPPKIAADVRDMRARIEKEKGTKDAGT